MRLALSGGGTGGHVYPALEVGRLAAASGAEVMYFGSHRGIEGKACAEAGIPFFGVEANPIPRLASLDGVRAIMRLMKSTREVSGRLREFRPDVLLATGGYSSAPALRAARSMGVQIVLHEQNSVPGRAISMMGSVAAKICTVFEKTCQYFPADKVVRTGMPIRTELSPGSAARSNHSFRTLVLGGSQGARAINQAVVGIAHSNGGDWQHVTGPKLFDEVKGSLPSMPAGYKLESFLDASAMKIALESADFAIARSGCGTISEFALFGLPAIYVPLPSSFADHQLYNAREIEAIGGGQVVEQSSIGDLEKIWKDWRDDPVRRERAAEALRKWAVPDAAQRVLQVVKEVAG